jgi:hypothetical protein
LTTLDSGNYACHEDHNVVNTDGVSANAAIFLISEEVRAASDAVARVTKPEIGGREHGVLGTQPQSAGRRYVGKSIQRIPEAFSGAIQHFLVARDSVQQLPSVPDPLVTAAGVFRPPNRQQPE